MRLRTIGLAAVLSTALIQTSSAVVAPKGAEPPTVAAGKAPRAHRTTAWSRDSQMAAYGLPGWTALWDRDTDVPLRMWGPPTFTAGAVAKPEVAEAAARAFLAAHLGLLAPGSAATDFALVANQLSPDGTIRSVGFQQTSGGVEVLGGTVSFSFKNDRLMLVGSTALPGVTIAAQPPTRIDATRLGAAATAWLGAENLPVAVRTPPADRVIVPIVHARTGAAIEVEYHLAEQLSVESTTQEPGRWDVWLDAATGAPLLRKSTLMFASGKIMFDVPDRNPSATRSPHAAPQVSHTVNGMLETSMLDGGITWDGTDPATVLPGLAGPLIKITNKQGSLTTDSLTLADSDTVTWSKADEEFGDAQLDAFVFASTAKAYVRANVNPELAWLDDQLSVNVNENQTCNAFSTGDDIHFYKASAPSNGGLSTQCQNTGRIADVVYHEFGHSVHANSVIPGVGAFESSLSEGLADMTAAFITDDHGMGRGFFYTQEPLRELEPTTPKKWPDDADGEPHDEGEIIGESLWATKKALVAQYGADAGNAKARTIYYGVMQRAADIPSSYAEALAADDDDGDLTNGTPNMCLINGAFGPHGLANPEVALGLSAPTRDNFMVAIKAHPPAGVDQCPGGATVKGAQVEWRKHGVDATAKIDLASDGSDTYSGAIPTQPDGTTVEYKVTVSLSDGTSISYPNNPADPYYQFYVGDVQKIWCADFEGGADDWTHGATPANRDEWEAGAPQGLGGDPKTAHGGSNVYGVDLSMDGMYRRSSMLWTESPEIDLAGNTNVRLQYYRWLGVEDGFYDNANILVNGTKVWNNFASPTETMNGTNHVDKEWRFQDFDLSAQAASGKVKLRFELNSDQGVNLGGWTLDDVCIVAAGPAPTCGNGVVDDGEQCDDGNIDSGDGCEATCSLPGSDDTGCCSVGATPGGAAVLSLLTFGMLIRRRRSAAAPRRR